MRIVAVLALCFAVAGCGLAARKEQQEAFASAKSQQETALAECEAKFPPGTAKQAVERAQCINTAVTVLRPFVPYPDLMDQDMANRSLMAERLQQGKITVAEANQELTQRRSQIVAEEQRRNLSNRAISAQESVAAAAWKGTSCSRVGNTVNCY